MTTRSQPLRIGVIDTGVNPWHPHVRGEVRGRRVFLAPDGRVCEDDDFRDLVGHGTAVAGILRQGLPAAELYVVRVFAENLVCYPSLVARGLLRAAAEGCRVINLSLGMAPGPGAEVLQAACEAVIEAGILLVAAGHPQQPGLLPASLPKVIGVLADEQLEPGTIKVNRDQPCSHSACGWPRELRGLPPGANLWGNSFACARVTLDFALKMGAV